MSSAPPRPDPPNAPRAHHHHRPHRSRTDRRTRETETEPFRARRHVLAIARQAGVLGGSDTELLVITTAWTGCRWGEITGLQVDHVDLDRGVIMIDPEYGALHKSAALASDCKL